jgi:hypothetical protein
VRGKRLKFAGEVAMIEPAKPSGEEIAYRVVVLLCVIGTFATVLTGLISGSQSGGLVFLVFLLFAGILLFRWRLRTREQRRRDEDAFRLFNAVRSGEIAKFAVFLRPFYTTKRIKITVQTGTSAYPGGPPANTTYHLEETLVDALSMPVLALGKPGEVYGVGRILESEDSWKSAASELMHQASLIICMPSDHPGSRWELDEILRNQYLEKTVFLMPRDPSGLWRKWQAMRDDWNAVVAHMESRGFRIPPYEREGLLFAIRPTIGCFIEDLSLTSSKELGSAIGRLSSPIPSSRRFEENKPTQSFVAGWIAALKRAFGRS